MSSKANILVVDDDRHTLLALRELLVGPDREVQLAGSGREALRMILKTDFALVLMDVRMPEMDGFETAALIRRIGRSRHTPLIFLTGAADNVESRARGYGAGAVDYILKPVDPEALKSKVAVFVGLDSRSASLVTQVSQHKSTKRQLSRANEELEQRIRERSASLIAANDRLRTEIAMRERAETEQIGRAHV